MTFLTTTRRQALIGAAAVTAGSLLVAEKAAGAATGVGGINAIPPLAAQWNELDLAEILSRPAAYMSVSQNKSLYDTGGAQAAERHRERGSLPATVKVVNAARKASNFKSFSWIGYEVFRENYPQTDFDRVQYASWIKGLNFTPEMKKWDNELVGELRALVRPGDNEFNELALQTASRRHHVAARALPQENSDHRADRHPPRLVHRGQCTRSAGRRLSSDRDRRRLRLSEARTGGSGDGTHQQLLRAGDLIRSLCGTPFQAVLECIESVVSVRCSRTFEGQGCRRT
jgi:hypothetical protein